MVLQEDNLTPKELLDKLKKLDMSKNTYINKMKASNAQDAVNKIINLIEKYK